MYKNVLAVFLLILLSQISIGQTIILDEPGPFVFSDQDMVITENYSVADITNCTSISFSFDYVFSLPWIGEDNLETPDECPIPCNGIVDAQNGGCAPCWDFLDAQATIDGTEVFYDIIGDVGTTDSEQTGTISMPYICTDEAADFNLRLRHQLWANDENLEYSNIMVICYEASPTVEPIDDVCSGGVVNLDGNASDNSAVDTWSWTASGGSMIDDPSQQNTTATNPADGETYTLTTTDINGCTASDQQSVTLLPSPTANMITIAGCSAELMSYDLNDEEDQINTTATVTWYNGQPSAGGTLIVPHDNVDLTTITELWALVDDGSGCTSEVIVMVDDTGGPSGMLSGAADLCPGECALISVNLSGGTPDYLVDVSFFGFPAISFPGFGVNDEIVVCYTPGDPFSFTTNPPLINLPMIPFVSSIDLTLNGIIDDAGCFGQVSGGPVAITFNDAEDINPAGPFILCDNGSGTALFVLSDYSMAIAGNGSTVNYYSDMNGNNSLPNNFTTGTTTIYAQVDGNPCPSEIIPIDLEVLSDGDAGVVTINCDGSETDCTICEDGNSQTIDLTITFGSSDVTGFDIEITDGNGTSTQSINTIAGDNLYSFTITGSTSFAITTVRVSGGCDDGTDLGGTVTITVMDEPAFPNQMPVSACGSYTLPAVMASSGPDPQYFSGPGGTGAVIPVGTVITTSTLVYLYAGVDGCDLESPLQITIQPLAVLDPIDNVSECGSYTLPPIAGLDITTSGYYTASGGPTGTGTEIFEGETITSTMDLWAYADCGGVEQMFTVTITPGPAFDVTSGSSCNFYILPAITGTDLTGNEAYFSETDGNGLQPMVGDTIFSDSTIYIYDPLPGCEQDIPFMITITSPSAAGQDSLLSLCLGSDIDIDAYSLLGANIDSTGTWIYLNGQDTLPMLDTFNFRDSIAGTYDYIYIVEDIACGRDTAEVTFVISDEAPVVGVGYNSFLCYDQCVNANVYGAGIDTFYLSISDGSSTFNFRLAPIAGDTIVFFDICNTDDGIFMGTNLEPGEMYTLTIDSLFSLASGCLFESGLSVSIETLQPITSNFTNNYCVDTDVIIGNETFNEANPTGMVTLPFASAEGCDSTVTVDLTFGSSLYETANAIICGDSLLDLSMLVTNFDGSGTFSEEVVSGGLSANIFNTSGLADADYVVIYSVPVPGPCPADTTEITVILTNGPTAGSDVDVEVCDRIVDLIDLLATDADLGGSFFENGVALSSTEIVIAPGDNFLFEYRVGGGGCNLDVAEIRVSFADIPLANFLIPLNFCYEECRDFRVALSEVDVDTLYLTISDGTDAFPIVVAVPPNDTAIVTLCNLDDGIFLDSNLEPNMMYFITIDSLLSFDQGCTYSSNLVSSPIRTTVYESTFAQTYCADTTIMIGDMVFDESNPSGIATIIDGGQFGCDSIVNVNLSFEDVNFGTMTYSACAGQPFVDPDFGLTWTETMNQDDVIIPAGSSNGCDSVVSVTVNFGDGVITPFPISFCANDSETVLGTTFDINNLTDTLNTGILSVSGCDSLVSVIATITDSVEEELTGLVCNDYMEEVMPGVIFDSDNVGTSISIGTAANGCDSLLVNSYTYSLEADTTYIDTTVCDENFFIQIGPFVYDINTPSGELDFPISDPKLCDSIISINIIYESLDVELDFTDPTCADENPTGSVIVNSVSVSGSYSIETANGILAFEDTDLPLTISDLPLGSQEVVVSNDQLECSVTEMYEFMQDGFLSFEISNDAGLLSLSNATEIDSIFWTPSLGLSCTDCLDPIADPSETTTYIANIFYNDGCNETAMITIEVEEPAPPLVDYYIPNVINPNSTSGNSRLVVVPSTFAEGLVTSMQIYDRWGNLIYFSDDAVDLSNGGGWNGEYAGSRVEAGVYVYSIVISELDGNVIRKVGDVTVLY